jgi:hypothetical protein
VEYVNRQALGELIQAGTGPSISIFIPDQGKNSGALQTRLRILVHEAERRLERYGHQRSALYELINPLWELAEQKNFWMDWRDGVAVFRCAGFLRCYRLPFRVPQMVTVGDAFQLRPLLSLVESNHRLYVLELKWTGAKLFWADDTGMVEVSDPRLANSLPMTVDQRRLVTGDSGGLTRRLSAFFRGRSDNRVEALRGWFRQVDEMVRRDLCEPSVPIVIAGFDSLCRTYLEVNSHPDLLPKAIVYDHEGFDVGDLHKQAWIIGFCHFMIVQRKAADWYYQLWHTPRSSNKLADISEAARQGRIEILFAATDLLRLNPGNYLDGDDVVARRDSRSVPDVLSLAAIDTSITGGAVYTLQSGSVPGGEEVAAVFRY